MIRMINREGQLNISFSWIFAIIVGIFILFLAIYGATKIIGVGQEATSAKAGKEIGVLFNPLETSFQEGQITRLSLPVDTRIENSCNSPTGSTVFGFQRITLYQKSFGKWSETDLSSQFENKYLFSEEIIEGKNFVVFSKPFEFPFKIADLIYITSSTENYCFIDASERIEEEISQLNPDNIFIEECPGGSIEVCFGGFSQEECDINVNEGMRSVEKEGEIVYYETDSLMYAAIFSDKITYECQILRLMGRAKELSLIYEQKQTNLLSEGCFKDVDVLSFANSAESLQNSEDLVFVNQIAGSLESQNNGARCRLW